MKSDGSKILMLVSNHTMCRKGVNLLFKGARPQLTCALRPRVWVFIGFILFIVDWGNPRFCDRKFQRVVIAPAAFCTCK